MKMTTLISLIIFCISCFSCCKEKCHREFTMVNNSQDSVIVGTVIKDVYGNCSLNGYPYVGANKQANRIYRHCIEAEFASKNLDFYLVDAAFFNDESGDSFYPCDSIEVNNTVLKRYSITLEELESNDFKVYYP
jgi:hypothetical protein